MKPNPKVLVLLVAHHSRSFNMPKTKPKTKPRTPITWRVMRRVGRRLPSPWKRGARLQTTAKRKLMSKRRRREARLLDSQKKCAQN